jgi:hypothetical protein
MQKIIIVALFLATVSVNAQKLELGLSLGPGKTYICEDLDKSIEVDYYLPVSLASELKFTQIDSKWGVKLRLHYIESAVDGINLPPAAAETFEGYVSTWSAFLMFEKDIVKDASSFGYNFGLGITRETVQIDTSDPWNYNKSEFPSITLGGHYTFKINESFDFQILPILIIQDPYRLIDYLTGTADPKIGGEDLSILLNFGIKYNFFKKVQ